MPIVVANARQSPVDRRGWSDVPASRNRIICSSDSPRNVCNVSSSLSLRMVSNARLYSIPRNSTVTRCRCALAHSQREPKTTSAVLRPLLNPDCDDDRYSSTFGAILDRTMGDSVFLSTESKTIGRRLVSGPVGLPGF